MKDSFGEILKYLRLEKEISQDELAGQLDISRSAISFWENNQREPTLSNLILIADFFGVTIDYLAGREK